MTLLPDAECARAIDHILKAKQRYDAGFLGEAVKQLRDLKIWAADFNEIVRKEMQETDDEEAARLGGMFGREVA
jgi:tRNA A37 threonylcarbamoyladenosine synthetase subunit TsaC/SUA5/YrdC